MTPITMEFTAVHSKEATNTSRPYYRWLPTSLPSSSFPPLWKWGILLRQIWLTAFTCPKPLSGIHCPQEVKLSHGSHAQDSLLACLLSGLCLLLLPWGALSSEPFHVLLSSLKYNLKVLGHPYLILNLLLWELFLPPNLIRYQSTLDLIHHQTWLSSVFFLMSVLSRKLWAS